MYILVEEITLTSGVNIGAGHARGAVRL